LADEITPQEKAGKSRATARFLRLFRVKKVSAKITGKKSMRTNSVLITDGSGIA